VIRKSRGLLLWPSFRQIDLHQMTVRRATFKLLGAVLRAPAIVSPAAILIVGRVTGKPEVILGLWARAGFAPASGRYGLSYCPTLLPRHRLAIARRMVRVAGVVCPHVVANCNDPVNHDACPRPLTGNFGEEPAQRDAGIVFSLVFLFAHDGGLGAADQQAQIAGSSDVDCNCLYKKNLYIRIFHLIGWLPILADTFRERSFLCFVN
jgi:hypothetical protein